MNVIKGEGAFGEGGEDFVFVIAALGRLRAVAADEMNGQFGGEPLGDGVQCGVVEGFDGIGGGAVDGTDVDPVGVQGRKKAVESVDRFIGIVEAPYHQDFQNQFARVEVSELPDARDDVGKRDAGDWPIEFFEAVGVGAIE